MLQELTAARERAGGLGDLAQVEKPIGALARDHERVHHVGRQAAAKRRRARARALTPRVGPRRQGTCTCYMRVAARPGGARTPTCPG